MTANMLTFLPEFLLVLCLPFMFLINSLRETKTAKTFYTLSKFFILTTSIFTVVFYNRSSFSEYWQNNTYTTLYKLCTYAFALAWFFLSYKWFLNKNRPSFAYYTLGVCSLISLAVMISANNMIILTAGIFGVLIFQILMIYVSDNDFDIAVILQRYSKFAMLFFIMFSCGVILVYNKAGTLSYNGIYNFFSGQKVHSLSDIFCCILIITPLLFMLGLAPFHFCFAEVLSICVLPVSGYFTIIPIFAVYGCLINLCMNVFFPMMNFL